MEVFPGTPGGLETFTFLRPEAQVVAGGVRMKSCDSGGGCCRYSRSSRNDKVRLAET